MLTPSSAAESGMDRGPATALSDARTTLPPFAQKRKPPSKLPLISLSVLLLGVLVLVYVGWRLWRRHRKRYLAKAVRLNSGKRAMDVDNLDMGLAMGAGVEWLNDEGRVRGRGKATGPTAADDLDLGSETDAESFDPAAALAEAQRRRRERRRRAVHAASSDDDADVAGNRTDTSSDEVDGQNALIYVNVTAAKGRLGQEDRTGSPDRGDGAPATGMEPWSPRLGRLEQSAAEEAGEAEENTQTQAEVEVETSPAEPVAAPSGQAAPTAAPKDEASSYDYEYVEEEEEEEGEVFPSVSRALDPFVAVNFPPMRLVLVSRLHLHLHLHLYLYLYECLFASHAIS
eukprot:gene10215-7159_t